MYRFRNSMLRTGIAASGCALFIYSLLLICPALIFTDSVRYLPLKISAWELAVFIGSFVLFEAVYYLYIMRTIRTNLRSITEPHRPLLHFCVDTAFLAPLFALAAWVVQPSTINPAVRGTVLISVSLCAGVFFVSASRIVAYALLVRLLCGKAGFLPMLTDGAVSFDGLAESTERMYNYCKRFNITLSFIGIRIHTGHSFSSEKETAVFVRQAAFLLSENSRNYEPWTLLPDSTTFLCTVQTKDTVELEATIERFKAVITRAQPEFPDAPDLTIVSETFNAREFDAEHGQPPSAVIREAFGRILSRLDPDRRKGL